MGPTQPPPSRQLPVRESGLRWPQLHRPQLSVTESGRGHNQQTFKDSVEEVELDYVLARFGIGFDKVRLI